MACGVYRPLAFGINWYCGEDRLEGKGSKDRPPLFCSKCFFFSSLRLFFPSPKDSLSVSDSQSQVVWTFGHLALRILLSTTPLCSPAFTQSLRQQLYHMDKFTCFFFLGSFLAILNLFFFSTCCRYNLFLFSITSERFRTQYFTIILPPSVSLNSFLPLLCLLI